MKEMFLNEVYDANYLRLFLSHDQTHQINFEYIAKEPFMFVSLFRCAEGYSGDPNVPGRGCTKSKFVCLCFVFLVGGWGCSFVITNINILVRVIQLGIQISWNYYLIWILSAETDCDSRGTARDDGRSCQCKVGTEYAWFLCDNKYAWLIPLWQWICMIGCCIKMNCQPVEKSW